MAAELKGTQSEFAVAEYAGVLCIESQKMAYESRQMFCHRAWIIAQELAINKERLQRVENVDLHTLRAKSHLQSCRHHLACGYQY